TAGLVQGALERIQLHLAQALDLVAEAGGALEFEVGGGLAHLRLEILEHGLEVGTDLDLLPAGLVLADRDGDVVLLVHRVDDLLDVGADRLRCNAVLEIVGDLLFAAAVGLGQRALHAAGLVIGVEDDAAVDVAGGAADGLDEAGLGAQETFLVGIEDGDQRAFGDVEALAQEVDADEHVEGAEAEIADDLDALDGVDVGVHVADADALLVHVLGEVLRHLLGEHGDERAVAGLGGLAHLVDDVVDLRLGRADLDRRIGEAGGADHLLGEDAAGLLHLPGAGGGADIDGLRAHGVPLLEAERAVVHGGRQAEAVFGEGGLAAEVAAIHGAELADGDVALVDEDEGIVGQVFEQGRRRLAGLAAGEVARIVLDAGAGAGGFHHLEVEQGALLEALRFEEAAGAVELLQARGELLLDGFEGAGEGGARRHVVGIGEDADEEQVGALLAGERIELLDGFDLVAEQRDAPGGILVVGGEELYGVTADAKGAAD